MKNKQTSSVVIVQGNLVSAYQLRQFLFYMLRLKYTED